ncbi:hypothetical protein [Shewanella sp.]|uniref:hypothetical protein n=1 Tax=Shewanella sp. TaxID=50422 RepID=UPI002588FA74|nr:hypothetical protein [Shewanella sp.]MCJ8301238.1 hypothetical protein [Shewanella sp.]
MRIKTLSTLVMLAVFLTACAATPPKIAQEKTVTVSGQTLKFGGKYDVEKNQLELTVNGDPMMKGAFPPYTPTQNFKANYKELKIASSCYFGSVLGEQGGTFGIIAGAIQASKSSSGDKCELFVDGESVETLYF